MVGNMTWWYNNNSYLKFTRDNPAYPDAIEYKKEIKFGFKPGIDLRCQ